MTVPISNACDRLLTDNPGTLPNMQGAMLNYFQKLTFTMIKKSVVDFNLVEAKVSSSFMGVRQPLNAQQLSMKPEGQRSWKWEMIHCFPDLILSTDDIIYFDHLPYRVMNKWDFKEYGYVLYEIVQDYRK